MDYFDVFDAKTSRGSSSSSSVVAAMLKFFSL